MCSSRERIINFYVELNRALKENKWTSLPDKDRKHLRNSIGVMTIDVLNGYLFTAVVEDVLSWLHNKTSMDIPALRSLLLRAPQTYKLVKNITIIDDVKANTTMLSLEYTEIDTMTIVVPYQKGCELREHSEDELITLVERYYILQPGGGFFWSAPPELYKFLSRRDDNLLEVIEGFGSPLNHNNLDAYCSLYADDHTFGSIGNFFHQIIHRGNSSEIGYRRWIINPPFTSKIMVMVYEAIMSRMNHYPHDEYYLLLPEWAPSKLVNLLETKGTIIRLIGSCYRLYNHMTDEYFSPVNTIIMASLTPNDEFLQKAQDYILLQEAITTTY